MSRAFRHPRAVPDALLVPLLLGALLGLSGCAFSDNSPAVSDGRVDVVTSFYPLEYVAERVGGDRVSVTNLTKPGAEPHDLELAPKDVAAIADSGLVVYLSGFQPAVDDAVAQAEPPRTLDVADAADLDRSSAGGADPHFWLDPSRLADVGDAVATQLAAVDPSGADEYRRHAAQLRADLAQLDVSYRSGLAACDSRDLVTSHAAFGYLAERYGLTQVAISGPVPESEPGAADLGRVADFVRDHGVTTVFYETLVSPATAQTVARETGAVTAVLDPLEGLTSGSDGDYLSVARSNLAALRSGLGCR